MRIFSFQNKRRVKIALFAVSIVLILLLLIIAYRIIYLGRYIHVADGKVVFDYSQDFDEIAKQASKKHRTPDIEIIVDDPVSQVSALADLPMETLSGNYITSQMLLDMDSVSASFDQFTDLPDAIMLDVKSRYGNFYYSSDTTGAVMSSADIPAVDSLIGILGNNQNVYLIARVSALSDTNYALAHQSYGLPRRDGALWMCDNGCYWLDPMEEDVQDYLVSIAEELASLGFDEVIFDNFHVPDSQNIKYSRDISREEATLLSAEAVKSKLSETPIRVSFTSLIPGVYASSDRVYISTEDGAAVTGLVESVSEHVSDPATQIVFLTPSRDTRFDGYGILRPLIEPREQ